MDLESQSTSSSISLQSREVEMQKQIVALLCEIHRRRLWKQHGYKSLIDFCQIELGYNFQDARRLLIEAGIIITQKSLKNEQPPVQERIEKLLSWRKQKSSTMAIAPYRVISNETLLLIACINPSTLGQLRQIKGIGDQKLTTFGDEILECLS